MSVPAAGWYPDPDPAGTGERFWDGSAWTPQTRPFLQQGTPSPTPASPAAVASTSAPEPEVSGAGRQAEETAGQPEGKVRRRKRNKSSSAARLERALEPRGKGPSAPVGRQAIRWVVDTLTTILVSAVPAAAAHFALGWGIVETLMASAAVFAVLVRMIPAWALRRGPGDAAVGCVSVVAVSGRQIDALYAFHSASFSALVLSVSAFLPATAALLALDLAFAFAPGQYRQTLSDRIAGVQLVVSRDALEEVGQ